MSVNLDDYLSNKPLSLEIAMLQTGVEDPMIDIGLTSRPADEVGFNDDTREWLRRLTKEPGWPILVQLIDSYVQQAEESAKILSQDNPLKNRNEVANQWAYVTCLKLVRMNLLGRIEAEIALLGQEGA